MSSTGAGLGPVLAHGPALEARESSLGPDLHSASEARRLVRRFLEDTGRHAWLDAVELAISEVATNADWIRPSVSLRSFLFAMTRGLAVDVVPAEASRCWREQRDMSSRRRTEPEAEKRVAALVLGVPKGTVTSRTRTALIRQRAALGDLSSLLDDHAA